MKKNFNRTVWNTWMVFPFFAFTTSPGLLAFPLGMFSQRGVKPKKNYIINAQQCTLEKSAVVTV